MKKNHAYTLKVSISDTRPLIRRHVMVPADIVLTCLHSVIQAAIGWSNRNPYFFIAQGAFYAEDLQPSGSLKDGRKTNLAALLRHPGDRMRYSLHAGEGWEHVIELEAVNETPRRIQFAQCTAGERRCPPEDCGGPRRFAELLKALARNRQSGGGVLAGIGRRAPKRRTSDPGQEFFQGWLTGPFDPTGFDLGAANAAVSQVRV